MNKNIMFYILILIMPICYGEESRFSSIGEMMEGRGDYPLSQYKLISNTPLHVQLSTQVMAGIPAEMIEEKIKNTIIYMVYRTFIHTNINKLTITALPLEVDWNGKIHDHLYDYEKTISISREKAKQLIIKHLNVSGFSELVSDNNINGYTFKDEWTKEFNSILNNNQGDPGITRFFDDMTN